MNNKFEPASKEKGEQILCSVCIATFRRPKLLEELLKSLNTQLLPKDVNMDIVVVDNDFHQSAKQIVRKFPNTERIRFHYYMQPEKNISLTRNLAIEKSSGEYILFIDDDEVASREWLLYMLNTLKTYNADGVFGFLAPRFHKGTPSWLQRRNYFYPPMTATGTAAKYTYTGNCLLKAALLKNMREPFDPQYGITGGGDTHLFVKLASQGFRFVNCREAVVWEYLPPARACLSYIFLNSLKGGNTYTRRAIEAARNKQFVIRLLGLSKALTFVITSLFFMVTLYPIKTRRIPWMIKLGSNVGRVLAVFGWHYVKYR